MVAAIFSGVWGLDAGKAPCLSEEPMTVPPWTPPPASALSAQQVLIACPR